MNSYVVDVEVLCRKQVYIKAETPEQAKEAVMAGEGLRMGYLSELSTVCAQNPILTTLDLRLDPKLQNISDSNRISPSQEKEKSCVK